MTCPLHKMYKIGRTEKSCRYSVLLSVEEIPPFPKCILLFHCHLMVKFFLKEDGILASLLNICVVKNINVLNI